MSKLQFDHNINNAGDYFGTIELKNFHVVGAENTVNNELFFRFSTPEVMPIDNNVNVSFTPWVGFRHETNSTTSTDHEYYSDIDIIIEKPHVFHAQDLITFYINEGLGNGVGENYVSNLVGFVDERLDPGEGGGGGCEGECDSCFDGDGSGGGGVHPPITSCFGI